MVAEFTPAAEDFRTLNALLAARSPLGRAGPWPVAVLFAAIFGWAAWTTPWPGGALWPVPVAVLVGAGIAWASFQVVARPAGSAALALQSRLAWARARRAGLVVPQRVEATAEGLRVASTKGETLARWNGLREVVATPDALVVFTAPRLAFVVPRRAFATAGDFAGFSARARDLWGSAR